MKRRYGWQVSIAATAFAASLLVAAHWSDAGASRRTWTDLSIAAPQGPPVERPYSIREVCAQLARRHGVRVNLDANVGGMRVAWAWRPDQSPIASISRLADLTGSRVLRRANREGRETYELERKPATLRFEAAWRREARLRMLRQVAQAADEPAEGQREAGKYSPGLQPYLGSVRAPVFRCVRSMARSQLHELADGREVRIPPSAVQPAEIEELVRLLYRDAASGGQRDVVQRATLERGVSLQFSSRRTDRQVWLMLRLGDGRSAVVLCLLGDEELSLPITRGNPYRLLETPDPGPSGRELEQGLDRPLSDDLLVPADGGWASTLRRLAEVAGVELTSDDYVCRDTSREVLRPGETLARRGTPLAEALDQVCRRRNYLWWESGGAVYLRSRTWIWDQDEEVPDSFLDTWIDAFRRDRRLGPDEVLALASLTPDQLVGLHKLADPTAGGSSLDAEDFQEFLDFFRVRTRPQQQQVLGRGLAVPPQQSQRWPRFLRISFDDAPSHPIVVRLRANTHRYVTGDLFGGTATLFVERAWQGRANPLEVAIRVPPLRRPSVPDWKQSP